MDIYDTGINLLNNLNLYRVASDRHTNQRGKALINYLAKLSLCILNGRSISDPLGQFTFVSHLGKSTIDLAVVNLEGLALFQDFQVIPNSESDHFPICLTLNNKSPIPTNAPPQIRVKWSSNIEEDRLLSLCSSFFPILANCKDSVLFEHLLWQITLSLIIIGVINYNFQRSTVFKKPWSNKITKKKRKGFETGHSPA